jgi:hypothetical protein
MVTYDLPFGRGARFSSGNWFDKVIGGWNVAGVWGYATGLPLDVINFSSCEEYGQLVVFGNCSGYLPINKALYNSSRHGNGTGAVNAFADPNAVANNFRPPDLVLDGRAGRGFIRSLNRWNVDFGVSKKTNITERVSTRFDMQITNVFNHPMLNDPGTELSSGNFGQLTNQYNAPRFIQFGLRIDF